MQGASTQSRIIMSFVAYSRHPGAVSAGGRATVSRVCLAAFYSSDCVVKCIVEGCVQFVR
eukprot:scaffold650362_cov47-Attheya_sp.AAC.1